MLSKTTKMVENHGLLNKILRYVSKQEGLHELLAMSKNRDGYMREYAVLRLGSLGNPIVIPELIVRVNDWVPQVRNAARESLEKLLKSENAAAFVYSLPDLYHLQKCGRADHSTLIAKVTNFLLKPENNSYIKSAIKNDRNIARIAVKLCIENSLIDRYELVSECLSHRDVVIRSIAADLLRDFSGEVLESFLRKAIQDPFMPIRREAFQIYLRVLPEEGLSIAKQFLLDRNMSIREIAINSLLKNKVDVERILNHILLSPNQSARKIRFAILGLAHIGAKHLLPEIINFASNSLPSIRKASLKALAKLLGENAKAYLLGGIKDQSPSVVKESARLVSKLNIKSSVEELLNIVETTTCRHTLMVCISTTRKMEKWDKLIFLLSLYRLSSFKDSNDEEILDKELSKWDLNFNLSSRQPSRAQRERLSYEYSQSRHLFDETRIRILDFTMKGWGINV